MRVVRDDDVDRRQVYRQQCQSRALLIARNFHSMLVLSVFSSRFPYMSILISGGYSDGAPPLPIPNREVKPVRADGTASSGRVGSRRFFQKSPAFHAMWSAGFLICIICMIRMKAASGLCIGSPDKPRGLGIHPCRSERVGLYILWYI